MEIIIIVWARQTLLLPELKHCMNFSYFRPENYHIIINFDKFITKQTEISFVTITRDVLYY